MKQNKRMTGSRYEELAAAFLAGQGIRILERNYRRKSGEIDLIAKDGAYLVFVEVKYRANEAAGFALEAIDPKKAAQVRRIAALYLAEKHYPEETPCRFDAVGIDGDKVTYIKDAF